MYDRAMAGYRYSIESEQYAYAEQEQRWPLPNCGTNTPGSRVDR